MRKPLVFFLAAFAAMPCLAQTPAVSLEARAINGVPIPGGPADEITVSPGDLVELVFRVRDWSTTPTTRLKAYQVALHYLSCRSGPYGNVDPLNFAINTDACEWCSCDMQPCPEFCIPSGDGEEDAVAIDTTDPAFVLPSWLNPFTSVDVTSCDYRMAAAILNGGQAPISQPGERRYVATLWLRVSQSAAGAFHVTPKDDEDNGCLLRNQNDIPILPVLVEGVTLRVAAPGPIVFSDPPNRAIDARQPSSPELDCADARGIDQVTLVHALLADGVGLDSYAITVQPTGPAPPEIVSLSVVGESVTLQLSERIPVGRWTQFTHLASGTIVRLGFLPGDVNGDRHTSPLDILRLIDHLNGVTAPPPGEHQTDVDRSGESTPADVLRLIDLLNGAGCFDAWNGAALPL